MYPTTVVNSSYAIISGLFKYSHAKVDAAQLSEHFTGWQGRINEGNYQSTFDYLASAYYDNFLKNIFPEIKHAASGDGKLNPEMLNHLTSIASVKGKPLNLQLKISREIAVPFTIPYVDLYLFPHELGIFSFKTELSAEEEVSLQKLSDFTNKIRHLGSEVEHSGEWMTIKTFIERHIIAHLKPEGDWHRYNPQLKIYLITDLRSEMPDEELDHLLYDLGNVSPPGTAVGNGEMAPSAAHLRLQLSENKITVFQNWSALALFDTFTRVSLNYPDKFKSWENEMFQIYIHCLYMKFYMYLSNTELSRLTQITGKTEQIRNNYLEFMNEHYLSHISYKWLANHVHGKMLLALDIKGEMEKMEVKISRINDYFKEKRSKSLNRLLAAITVIALLSVLLSNWSLHDIGEYLKEALNFFTGTIKSFF